VITVLCSAKVCEIVVVVFDAFVLSDCGTKDWVYLCTPKDTHMSVLHTAAHRRPAVG